MGRSDRRRSVRLHRRRAEQLRRRQQRRAVRVPERRHRGAVARRRDVRAIDPTHRTGGRAGGGHRHRDRRDRPQWAQRPRLRSRRPPLPHRPGHLPTIGPRAVADLRARRIRQRRPARRARPTDVSQRHRHRSRRQRGVGGVVHRHGPAVPSRRHGRLRHRHVARRPSRRRRSRRGGGRPSVRHDRQRRRHRCAQRRRQLRPVHRGRNDPDELRVRRHPPADDRRRSDRRHTRRLVHRSAVGDRNRYGGRPDLDRQRRHEGGDRDRREP